MTSLLKRNLHQMVDFASKDKVITACGREDVCRFLLHSFMDYLTDHGSYDSSFEVLMDWSHQLNVYVDNKDWKVRKQSIPSSSSNNYNPLEPSCSHKSSKWNKSNSNSLNSLNSLKRHKKSSIKSIKKSNNSPYKPILNPSNSVPVTPINDDNDDNDDNDNNDININDELKTKMRNYKFTEYSSYRKQSKSKHALNPTIFLRPRAKSHGAPNRNNKNNKLSSKRVSKIKNLHSNSNTLSTLKKMKRKSTLKSKSKSKKRSSTTTAPITPYNEENEDWNDYNSEISEWNNIHLRKWSVGDSLSDGESLSDAVISRYSVHSEYNIDYISKLSHSTWMLIAQFLNTSSKATGLGLVNREMNLLCFHPICWNKLCIKIDNLLKLPLNIIRRSFVNLYRFELNWNNPETPLSLLYLDGINDDNNIYGNNIQNGYIALKYSAEIELFFINLSSVCNKTLYSFKLSMHGGPYRLANSAPTAIKIFQTESLLRLVFSNFNNLRKFKMDAYNLIAVDIFINLLKKYSPNLQYFESQIVVYDRQQQRVILENPVLLNDINILPSTLKHLCLPLLADDSWIINQYLPNLQYLFFFGYTRSSGYALHENFLSVRCLDYIAGQNKKIPNCPKIRCIQIALRQNDYFTIILRPIIIKLFLRCKYLENVKLATAGNLDLAQNLYSSLYASNMAVCHVFAKDEGRPEKPIGVIEFRRNLNYKLLNKKFLSVPSKTSENTITISEMAHHN